MGLFDSFRSFVTPDPPKKATKPRGKGTDPDIVRKRFENRALQRLEKRDPDRLDNLVLEKAGYYKPPVPEKAPQSDFDITMTTVERMKKAGMFPKDGPEPAERNSMSEGLLAFLGGLGSSPAIQAKVASMMGGPSVTVEEPHRATLENAPAALTVTADLPQIVAPSSTPALGDDSVLGLSAMAIGALTGKSPPDAALLLIQFPDARAKVLVGELCEADDASVPSVLFAVSRRYPELADLVEWLVQPRNVGWTIQTVQELRARSGLEPINAVVLSTAPAPYSGV